MKGFWIKFRLPGHDLATVTHMDMTNDATAEDAVTVLMAMRPGSRILTVNGESYTAPQTPADAPRMMCQED